MGRRFLISFICICLILCAFSFANAQQFSLSDGLYMGVHEQPYVDTPNECIVPNQPGHVRIVNLDNSVIKYINILMWGGIEIPIGEKLCVVNGASMNCTEEPQYLDMTQYGYDAYVTNSEVHGVYVINMDGTFVSQNSIRKVSCTAASNPELQGDCPIVAEWMMGEGGFLPCDITPWRNEYTRISD